MHRAGMEGTGFALMIADSESAARALEVEWDEYTLDKLLICAEIMLASEKEMRASKQNKVEIPEA